MKCTCPKVTNIFQIIACLFSRQGRKKLEQICSKKAKWKWIGKKKYFCDEHIRLAMWADGDSRHFEKI